MKIIKDDVDRLMDWVHNNFLTWVDFEDYELNEQGLEKRIRRLLKKMEKEIEDK